MKIKSILVGIWVLIILPTMTYALFVDTVTSQGNTFSAATLTTQITPTDPVTIDITEAGSFSTSFNVQNTGQINSENLLSIEATENLDFASKIVVDLNTNSFVQSPSISNSFTVSFTISQDDFENTQGESTTFSIENTAWQDGMPLGSGFSDNDTLEITLTNPNP